MVYFSNNKILELSELEQFVDNVFEVCHLTGFFFDNRKDDNLIISILFHAVR